MTISGVVVEAEENTAVTLPCSIAHFYTRTWQRVNGDVLFSQEGSIGAVFHEGRPAARADMSVSNSTFALTIRMVKVVDDTMFLCTSPEWTTIRSIKLVIYGVCRVLCICVRHVLLFIKFSPKQALKDQR